MKLLRFLDCCKSGFSLYHKILLGIFSVIALTVFLILGYWLFPTPSHEGYAPQQPIPFSHKRHAGLHQIDCRYCHGGAYKSAHAGIPSMNICMNCHSVVKLDSPHIQLLHKLYNEKKPIEWVRIHELPDHARFNHKRHLAKGVTCENCHGDVKTMDVVYQKNPLTMGWCLQCHRGQTTPKQVLHEVYPGEKDPKGPVAPFNCSTCHY